MATTSTIDSDSIYLEPCENGYILYWTVCNSTQVGMSLYDVRNNYCTEKEVFKASESGKAIARMNEIYKSSGEEMNDKD